MAWTKEQFKALYEERKSKLIAMFGGHCTKCGSTENLQFHHVDPDTKIRAVMKSINRRWSVVVKEARKCVLLCADCHVDHHHDGLEHGTRAMYTNGKCRCDPCREAQNAYCREWKRQKRCVG